MTAQEVDPQFIEKSKIREWLKDRGLSMKWLASWLNKSEGTVRNWFYGGNKITEENLDSICVIQENFDNKRIGREENPKSSSIPAPQKETYYAYIGYLDDKSAKFISHTLGRSTEHCFGQFGDTGEVDTEVPEWVKDVVEMRSRDILRQEKKRREESQVPFLVNELEMSEMEDLHEISDEGYWLIPSEIKSSYVNFARMAAKLAGYDSFNAWLENVLMDEAQKIMNNEFEEFISGENKSNQWDDDIPF